MFQSWSSGALSSLPAADSSRAPAAGLIAAWLTARRPAWNYLALMYDTR